MDRASYINHQLNTSVYRNSCRFSKAERFANHKHTYNSCNSGQLISITISARSLTHVLVISASVIAPGL
jgi:hypothetical protein